MRLNYRLLTVLGAVLWLACLMPCRAVGSGVETMKTVDGHYWSVDLKTGASTLAEEPPAPTTKWSLTLAARTPDWMLASVATYDFYTLEELFGRKDWTLLIVGIGGADNATGQPTGGFGLVARPRIAKNVYADVGFSGLIDDKARFQFGVLFGIRALVW